MLHFHVEFWTHERGNCKLSRFSYWTKQSVASKAKTLKPDSWMSFEAISNENLSTVCSVVIPNRILMNFDGKNGKTITCANYMHHVLLSAY